MSGTEGALLVCYDRSDGARRAIEQAAALFPGARALVLNVWSFSRMVSGYGVSSEASYTEQSQRELALRDAEAGCVIARDAGLDASPVIGVRQQRGHRSDDPRGCRRPRRQPDRRRSPRPRRRAIAPARLRLARGRPPRAPAGADRPCGQRARQRRASRARRLRRVAGSPARHRPRRAPPRGPEHAGRERLERTGRHGGARDGSRAACRRGGAASGRQRRGRRRAASSRSTQASPRRRSRPVAAVTARGRRSSASRTSMTRAPSWSAPGGSAVASRRCCSARSPRVS